jgi:hypothetical protein
MNSADLPRVALHEAIEALAAMPAFLAAAIDSLAPALLTRRPAEDAFAMVEQACHLRDLEREGYVARARRMLAEEMPGLEGFDGAAVAGERGYLAQDARLACREFAQARSELVALLAPLSEAELAREATFEGRRITLRDLAAMASDHDRVHRAEIAELLRALRAR